ncbi:hypothetical protein H0H93_012104, partial [Arthromyces matolae]
MGTHVQMFKVYSVISFILMELWMSDVVNDSVKSTIFPPPCWDGLSHPTMWTSRNSKKRKVDTSFDISIPHEPARTTMERLHLDTLSVSTSKGAKRRTDGFRGEKALDMDMDQRKYPDFFVSHDQTGPDLDFLQRDYFESWDKEHETGNRSKARTASKWNDSFFEKTTLKQLGLRIQLNHVWNDTCPAPRQASGNDFVIIDTLEIHEVALDFCNCEKSKPWEVQLLRSRLYPTTATRPSSAVTFGCLRHFQLLSFESKCSVFEYIGALSRATDNTGVSTARDRYNEFLRVVRQYRHLKMLKRSGRGHEKGGIAATQPGECALTCPACPQPGRNLPTDWKKKPEDKKYLYALFVALDANFKLKRKTVSSEERDPSLGQGWAFFVEETKYKAFLNDFWHEKQPKSNCVSHDAVNKPDREARGLAASGAGTVDCSRHDLKRPCSVGDLQLGERYINMDYVFFQSLRNCKLERLVVSYDIACQWHLNIRNRMIKYPHYLHLSNSITYMSFLVPKFHLPAHIEDCNLLYSFNLAKGVGQTDGEAPERGWANINPLSQSTKEMGPGNRRDTIDDFFNDWNWKKITKFGSTMLKKIHEAASSSKLHDDALKDFEDSIPQDIVKTWREAVESWERDPSKPNPYRSTTKELSERAVRLKLAKQVAVDEGGGEVETSHEMHASTFIAHGLALEGEQRKLSLENSELGDHPTPTQLYRLTERSNQLRRKITTWTESQVSIIPEAARKRLRTDHRTPDGTPDIKVENIKLWLPSELAASGILVSYALRDYEWQLRHGQAHDALDEVRNGLRLQAYLYKHKDRYAVGVKANTRSNTAIANATGMVKEAAKRYRVARGALLTLSETGIEVPLDWQLTLRALRDEDCRKLTEGLEGDSESRRTISWIWLQFPSAAQQAEDPRLNDALKVEWSRARARSMRWTEEVELLQEEMRRICQYLSWESDSWKTRATTASHEDTTVREGMAAFAQSQQHLRCQLQRSFE